VSGSGAVLATALLLAFTSIAAVTDLLWSKIYNWNTYGGIVLALAARAWHGTSPLVDGVEGLLSCGGLMTICFVVFAGIGGGDVKLMAMLGAWLGWEKGVEALLWTFVLAAAFAMIGLIWRIGPLTALGRAGRLIGSKLRLYWFVPLSEEERRALKLPIFIGPSALAAVLLVEFGKYIGIN
jgi:Flp pilus assembly protein protease CpaA